MAGICTECGNQIWDSCSDHPSATVDSLLSSMLDSVDLRIETAIDKAAEAYRNEFDTLKLDAEWSETAYSDLSNEEQARISWSEFHNCIQATLEA